MLAKKAQKFFAKFFCVFCSRFLLCFVPLWFKKTRAQPERKDKKKATMNLNPVILAIPMYFTLMGIELAYESITRRKTYRLNDAVTNISTGVLQQLTGTFFKIVKVGLYVLLYEQFAVWELGQSWATFALAFIAWDFCYYWEHRMAHEISLFWGGHSVHHQSEDYNLSVALRQTSTGFIWGTPFFLPMAILGFHPTHFLLVGGFNLLYQFWIHTEHIGKLPRWFEYIFNTPSHHRVHHGRNPKYIDKNYAGVFIIWDRMFGTFKVEEERPDYGITKPLKSWNPVYANFAHYIDLYHLVKQARSVGDGLKILFKPPGWMPEYLGGYQRPTDPPDTYQKYNVHTTMMMNLYILVQFIAALGFIAYYFFTNTHFGPAVKSLYAVWIIFTTLMFGFLFESNNRWLKSLEVLRLLLIPAGVYGLIVAGFAIPIWLLVVSSIFAGGSILVFFWLMRRAVVLPVEARAEGIGH
jgi:alkylglycerol monooxygenase